MNNLAKVKHLMKYKTALYFIDKEIDENYKRPIHSKILKNVYFEYVDIAGYYQNYIALNLNEEIFGVTSDNHRPNTIKFIIDYYRSYVVEYEIIGAEL